MRIALPNGHCGLNDKGDASDIRPIEKAVEQFCRWVSADYLKIILDGAATLEERFSKIDARLVQKELSRLTAHSEKVPPQIKKLIKMPELPDLLVALFSG